MFILFSNMKTRNFRGELTNTSARKKSLDWRSMKVFSKFHYYFILFYFLISKTKKYRGDRTDVSAKQASLEIANIVYILDTG